MTRKQRVELIVKILLWPYTRPPFSGEDLLAHKASAYETQAESPVSQHSQQIKTYEKIRTQLSRAVAEEVHIDRLGEVNELVEMFFPEREMAKHLKGHPHLDLWYLERLLSLSTEFVTLRDGVASIKMWAEDSNSGSGHEEIFPRHSGLYKVELWSEISRVITPDTLITAYFIQCGIRDELYLQNLSETLALSDSVLAKVTRRGLAETHLHLSVGMGYLSVWEAVTDVTAVRPISQKKTQNALFLQTQEQEMRDRRYLVIAGFLRLMLARYLVSPQAKAQGIRAYWQTYAQEDHSRELPELRLLNAILGETPEQDIQSFITAFWAQRSVICDQLCGRYQLSRENEAAQMSSFDLLTRMPGFTHCCRSKIQPELLLLFLGFRYLQEQKNRNAQHADEFAQVFLCYIRIKNRYFRERFQSTDTKGLTFFRRYFRKSSDSFGAILPPQDETRVHMIYRAAFQNQFRCENLQKLEVKISPPRVSLQNGQNLDQEGKRALCRKIARQLSTLIGAYLDTMADASAYRKNDPPTLGIVFHFIRGDTSHSSRDMCWTVQEGEDASDLVSRTRNEGMAFLDALLTLLRHIPGLSELVVGIDTASEELYADPWVYAPVYHHARNRLNTYPVQREGGQHIQNLGLTYHVGEDYHHLLSGLRHIDEVLSHFGYKAGDRIGHGLALQLDVEDWIDSHEVVSLPIMDYLEDLLWVWDLCGQEDLQLIAYRPELEQEIMRLAEKIYHNVRGITPQVLWRTYQRKFDPLMPEFCQRMYNSYLKGLEQKPIYPLSKLPAQRGFCVLLNGAELPPQDKLIQDEVWDSDKLLTTHYCPIYRSHYKQPCFVHNSRRFLPLFQKLQSYLREKIQYMGVYVETNPTSNLAIGDFRGLVDYPIDSLNDPEGWTDKAGAVMMTVNSDDPLVFNTNVENELALVYHTLSYRNISREATLKWIEKIRQYGMDSSFIRRVKTAEEQREDLQKVQHQLNRVITSVLDLCE